MIRKFMQWSSFRLKVGSRGNNEAAIRSERALYRNRAHSNHPAQNYCRPNPSEIVDDGKMNNAIMLAVSPL
jgi:hypothetical protein